jgi:hypothetical protein
MLLRLVRASSMDLRSDKQDKPSYLYNCSAIFQNGWKKLVESYRETVSISLLESPKVNR